MSETYKASRPLPVLLDYSLLKGERIRPPVSPPGDPPYESEDEGVREMSEKIKQVLKEDSIHAPAR